MLKNSNSLSITGPGCPTIWAGRPRGFWHGQLHRGSYHLADTGFKLLNAELFTETAARISDESPSSAAVPAAHAGS
jgi:hypothetical protein